MYPDECRLEIPSRGIDAKLHVTTSNHILVNLADFGGTEEHDYDVCTSKRGRESEETGTESEMTDGTVSSAPAKRTRRGVPKKPRIPRKKPPPAYIQWSPALHSVLRKLQHAAARESLASAAEWARVSRAADKPLALLLPDKGPRSMQISTVYMSQEGICDDHDTENEYETETDDKTQHCDETEHWLMEDYFRQRCEVKARRDTQKCCRILTALGRKDWRNWNDVPLELRKAIE